jgi:hypothetical protein
MLLVALKNPSSSKIFPQSQKLKRAAMLLFTTWAKHNTLAMSDVRTIRKSNYEVGAFKPWV